MRPLIHVSVSTIRALVRSAATGRFQLSETVRWVRRFPLGVVGAVVLSVTVCAAAFPEAFTVEDPARQRLVLRLKPPGWVSQEGSWYVLGTDQLGRSVWSRIVHGARISIAVGVIGVSLSAVLGVTLGIVAAYSGGLADMLIMRSADIQLSFPFILLALVWAAFVGNSLLSIIVIVGIRGWADLARLVRAKALGVVAQDFVLASRALGASDLRLMTIHILPSILPLVLIVASLQFGRAIILEATLAFLGLGVAPPTPTWGGMLSDGRAYLGTAWWLTTLPGLAIMVTVLSSNTLGDAVRDALDPRLRT